MSAAVRGTDMEDRQNGREDPRTDGAVPPEGNARADKEATQSGEKGGWMRLIRVKNLHCAACALDLQDELEKIKGVNEVAVDFITQSIRVDVADEDALRKVIRKGKILQEGDFWWNFFEKVWIRIVSLRPAAVKAVSLVYKMKHQNPEQ